MCYMGVVPEDTPKDFGQVARDFPQVHFECKSWAAYQYKPANQYKLGSMSLQRPLTPDVNYLIE
jgi:hypothetical protein